MEDRAHRSWTMAQVKSKNTTPEVIVRRAAHALGLRFRLHREDLPGEPDLVFPRLRVALFVNGCFWHSHKGCSRARVPRSNDGYWKLKLPVIGRSAGPLQQIQVSGRRHRTVSWVS